MKRPLTDFFEDRDIERAYMLSTKVPTFCFGCEEPLGQSHYRISSVVSSVTVVVCSNCATDLKRNVIQKRRNPKPRRPHFEPLTKNEINHTDRFKALPGSAPAPAAEPATDFFEEM